MINSRLTVTVSAISSCSTKPTSICPFEHSRNDELLNHLISFISDSTMSDLTKIWNKSSFALDVHVLTIERRDYFAQSLKNK